MALRTCNNVIVLIGDTLADRPNPASIATEGAIFHDLLTGDCSILVIDKFTTPFPQHRWDRLCCGTSGCSGGTA
jgi:hypothetical protein